MNVKSQKPQMEKNIQGIMSLLLNVGNFPYHLQLEREKLLSALKHRTK